MRMVFVILFAVFIGAGFLLSDNIHMREDLVTVQIENTELLEENQALHAQLRETTEKLAAGEKVIIELTQRNLALEKQAQESNSENLQLRSQNKELQEQVDALQAARLLQPPMPTLLRLAILLPLFPASIAVTYILVRRKGNGRSPEKTFPEKGRRTSIQLTDEEIQTVIKMRRNK